MQDGSTCLILTMSCPRHRTRRKYPRAPANGEGPHPLWRAEVIRSKLWAEKDVPALETVRVEEEALGAADGMNSPKGGTRRARIPGGLDSRVAGRPKPLARDAPQVLVFDRQSWTSSSDSRGSCLTRPHRQANSSAPRWKGPYASRGRLSAWDERQALGRRGR